MSQETQNLKLKLYDVSSDSMPAFVNGVAGITDSNMTKIDEAITEKVRLNDKTTNINLISENNAVKTIEATDSEGHKTSFSLSTDMDTDHITTRTGHTEEERYTALLSKFGKKFNSNGEDITVENGIENQRLLGAKISGQTVKNYLKNQYVAEIDYSKNTSVRYISLSKDQDIVFKSGVEYCLVIDVESIDFGSATDKNLYIQTLKIDDQVNKYSILGTPTVGINKFKFSQQFDYRINGSGIYIQQIQFEAGYKIKIKSVAIIEFSQSTFVNGTLAVGLNSTQATLTNNGEKYSFYNPIIEGKTYFMKAKKGTQEWVIDDISEERDFDKYDYKWDSPNGLHHVYKYRDKVDLEKREITTCINHIELDDIIDNKFINVNLYPSTNTTIFSIPLDFTMSIEAPQNYFLAVSNTFKSSTFVQGALGEDKTKELESCFLLRVSGKKAVLYMRTKKENSGITEASFREYYRGKGISFKAVGDPITRPLTDEEYEMYSKQKKPIELNKVKDTIDTFEITENEARFTQNVRIQDIFYDCGLRNVGEEVVTIEFGYMPVEYTGRDKIMCNKLKTIPFDDRTFPQEEYISYYGYKGLIAISKSKLKDTKALTVVDYLNQHDYKILIPSKEKNKVTVFSKESTLIIPTYETNNFSFGDGIKPSSVEITVPVDRISELEAKINTKMARLEALESALIDVALDK